MPRFILTLSIVCLFFVQTTRAEKFTVIQNENGAAVNLNGKLLTQYLIKSGHKPIFWPVIGPNGKEITRSYPMVADGKPMERKDHVHHRSFWFTHGNVNGVDFWAENEKAGHIIHKSFKNTAGGDTAVIVTKNDWIGPDGTKHCEDVRSFTFGADGTNWWVDCDIIVTASGGDVTFGDTKEGSFGVRLAGTMKVDKPGKGTIVNSEGQTDRGAWGKRAAWVDYYGPLEGKTVGCAIMNHPDSFRHPTHWHVRTYGLFTANPFGLHHFEGKKLDELNGAHTLEPGESFTLKHRVLFHQGDEK